MPPEIRLPDGTMWKNLVTPEKSKVAETLDEFRGNYTYNLLDEHVRRFNAEIPQFVLWDDHEVKNNWYPGHEPRSRRALHGKETRACWPPMRGARFSSTRRFGSRAAPCRRSIDRARTVRFSRCSRSTCGPTAARTRRTGRRRRAPKRRMRARSSWRG